MRRYSIQHEFGNDYAIYDSVRRIVVANGLSYEEANETADLWEAQREQERSDLV